MALPVLADSPSKPAPAASLLEQMSRAFRTLNYKGTFVYLHGGRLETIGVVHRSDNKGWQERLTRLTGSMREVVRSHRSVQCILPEKRLIVIDNQPPDHGLPRLISSGEVTPRLKQLYRFRRLGHQRTAGRKCIVVAVVPKDGYRYGYRLWLDQDTKLLLRSQLVGPGGDPVERVMFTHIELTDPIAAEAIKPTIDSSGFTERVRGGKSTTKASGSPVTVTVKNLPAGYKLAVDEVRHIDGIGAPVRHLVFTDGLATLSVYATPYQKGKDVLRGLSQRGSVNAYGLVLDGYQITVVGGVPDKTVKAVAQSVQIAGHISDRDSRGSP